MEQTVKERIMLLMNDKKLSIRSFERMCGLSNGYIKSLRKSPTIDKMRIILDTFPELNQQWLMSGEGDMYINEEVAGNSGQSVKQRLLRYVEHTGMSTRKFERTIGVSNAYLANLVRNPKDDVVDSILKHFPDLNRVWLLTGEGKMLKTESENQEIVDNTTLLLPTSARGGSLVDFATSVSRYECERVISPIKGIDFAMTVTGESMAPEYPNGSRVFIKRINERAFIDWGRVYVLDTCNGAVIKKVLPGSTPECVRCVSLNKEYPDFEVQFNDMYGMYRVLLLLTEK